MKDGNNIAILPKEDEDNIVYLIFGGDASNELLLNDFEEAVKNIESDKMLFSTLSFNKKEDDPLVLLDAYDGYNGYAVLTKEQYEVLSNL